MKLKIKNFHNFLDQHRVLNSDMVIDHARAEQDKYCFCILWHGDIWEIHLHRQPDFMPGWPVDLWFRNQRILSTQVSNRTLSDKPEWAEHMFSMIVDGARFLHQYKTT